MKFPKLNPKRRRAAATAAVLAGAMALVGCASATTPNPAASSDAPQTAEGPEVTQIKAAIFRTIGGGSVYAAESDGYAADYGIQLSHEYVESSTAAVSLLVGGSVQLAFASYFGVINANLEGVPLVIIGEGLSSTDDFVTIEALPGSGIKSIKDLEGATVGITSMNSPADGRIRDAMTAEGLDANSVTFVVVPFNEMAASLETGAIDAGSFTGPGQADVRDRLDTVEVFDFGTGAYAGFAESGYIMTRDFVDANPRTVRAVQCALKAGAKAITADTNRLYELAAENMGIDKSALEGVPLPGFEAGLRLDRLQQNIDIMLGLGILDAPFDMASITVPTPTDC